MGIEFVRTNFISREGEGGGGVGGESRKLVMFDNKA